MTENWRPTIALRRAIWFTLVLLVIAVVLGRADLVVFAAPFAVGVAFSLRRRPEALPEVALSTEDEYLVEDGPVTMQASVSNLDDVRYDLVLVRSRMSEWLDITGIEGCYADTVPERSTVDIALAGRALRWGWHAAGPIRAHAVACDGLVTSETVITEALMLRVFPRTDPFEANDAMPKAAGLVGAHRSRRYGDGGELAGIRQFTPGDRLRRIDWRTSLRTGEVHVAHTLSDRDAEVVLLLDVLHDAGDSGGIDGQPSVLDTTVRAAAGIAQHYLERGDRVAMLEYGAKARTLRAGSGRRHYLSTLEWLLHVVPGGGPFDVFAQHMMPSSALVVVLSPLLEPRSAAMAARLARAGRSVVTVDTLPAHAKPVSNGSWTDVAYRLWRLDRENTMGQLLEHGVPTVAWSGAGSLDQVLQDVSRMAAAPAAGWR